MNSEQIEFTEWVGKCYIRMHGGWMPRFANQSEEPVISTESLWGRFREHKSVFSQKHELPPEEVDLKDEFTALLEKFSESLLEKLMTNERKYGFGNAWKLPGWEQELQRGLAEHVQKGDPKDVAIYAMFAWMHNWRTAPLSAETPE